MKNFIGGVLICLGIALGFFTFGCSGETTLDANTIYFFTKPGCKDDELLSEISEIHQALQAHHEVKTKVDTNHLEMMHPTTDYVLQ